MIALRCSNIWSPTAVNNQRRKSQRRQLPDAVGLLLFVLFLPVIVPVVVVWLMLHLLVMLFLHIAVWCFWCMRGRYILFVYSDSPIWHDHIQNHILPRLGERAVILNWSQRARWRQTLAVLAFRRLGGDREFNPMAIVFRPLRTARYFRFYEPFREFKHGKTEAVTKMETELFELVDETSGTRAP